MAVLYITEFPHREFDEVLPCEPALADQAVAFTASPAQSAAFGTSTRLIRVSSDTTPCCISIGANPTAATTSRRIAANQIGEYFVVRPGWKVSVIAATL